MNERTAFDAIHLLIHDPDLYRGSQVDAIAANMSPLQIVADRRVLHPDEVTQDPGHELDYAYFAGVLDRGDREQGRKPDYACFAAAPARDDLERARVSLAEVRDGLDDWDRRRAAHERPSRDTAPARPPTSRLDPAAREADRARRDVAEQEAQRHTGTQRRTDLAAKYDAEPHLP